MPPARDFVLLARLDARLTEDLQGIYTRHGHDSSETVWQRTLKPLGRGGMGEVYREQCISGTSTGRVRAVKAIQKPNTQFDSKIDYSRELEAIARFSQPQYERCFVKSFGWYETIDMVFIAMEYVEHGDLQQYVGSPMAESEMQRIAAQVLEGLAFLHGLGYAHRDLKPANLLVFSKRPQLHIKIADFGLSKRIIEDLTSLRTQAGTLGYMALELMGLGDDDDDFDDESTLSYTNAVDIWALGVISFVMLTGNLPFLASNWRPLKRYVQGKDPFPSNVLLTQNVSTQGCAWIESCMAPKPGNRPSAGFSRRHGWPMGSESLESSEESSLEHSCPETIASASWTTHDQTVVPVSPVSSLTQRPLAMPIRNKPLGVPDNSSLADAGNETHPTAVKVLVGHTHWVMAVTFSPDGQLIATVSWDGTARLWNVASGTEVKRLDHEYPDQHKSPDHHMGSALIEAVAFSPDGRLVVTAGSPPATLWNTSLGIEVRRLYYTGFVQAIAFSPDGRLLATASTDRGICFWDVASGNELWKLDDTGTSSGRGTSVAFSPDGHLVAAVWADANLSCRPGLWEPVSGRKVSTLEGHQGLVVGLAFSPNSQLVATASVDKTVRLWDVSEKKTQWAGKGRPGVVSGKEVRTLEGHGHTVESVAFSPNGRLVASSSSLDKTVRIWDVTSGKEVQRLEESDGFGGIAFSPDGRLLAMVSSCETVRLWDFNALLSLSNSQLGELQRQLLSTSPYKGGA